MPSTTGGPRAWEQERRERGDVDPSVKRRRATRTTPRQQPTSAAITARTKAGRGRGQGCRGSGGCGTGRRPPCRGGRNGSLPARTPARAVSRSQAAADRVDQEQQPDHRKEPTDAPVGLTALAPSAVVIRANICPTRQRSVSHRYSSAAPVTNTVAQATTLITAPTTVAVSTSSNGSRAEGGHTVGRDQARHRREPPAQRHEQPTGEGRAARAAGPAVASTFSEGSR